MSRTPPDQKKIQPTKQSMSVVYSRKRLRASRASRALADADADADADVDADAESEAKTRTLQNDKARSHAAPASPTRAAPKKRRRRALVQTHLDVGQRHLTARQCADCGMVYAPGALDDDHVHARHHAYFVRRRHARLPFAGWMGERVVASVHSGRLVAVKACDVAAWRARVARVDAFVSDRLGGPSAPSPLDDSHSRWLAILFVADRLVEAYALAELVTQARVATLSHDGIPTVCEPDADDDARHLKVEGTLCGIRKIWVAASWRRKRIASAIVDAARVNLLYGHVIDESKVAFTATTPAGSKFAQSYAQKCAQPHILIY